MPGGRVLILKAGRKLDALADRPGDFEDWIAGGLDLEPGTVHVVDVRADEAPPTPSGCAGVVATGSAAMVSDREPWAEATAAWLRDAVAYGVPVLGICFGHQLLAHALGGTVGDNPNGVEVGTVTVTPTTAAADDPLFGALPEPFAANMSHRQSVLALPPGATLLARTDADPHAAFRHGTNAWGVQFHPEFDAAVTRAHVDWYRPALAGRDAVALRAGCRDTPVSHGLLARFAALIHGKAPDRKTVE